MSALETTLTPALDSPLSREEAAEYDAFVDAAAGGAWAQARAWAKVAVAGRRMTPWLFRARRGKDLVGAALVLRPRAIGPIALPVAMVPRGPVVEHLGDLRDVLDALRAALVRRGALRLGVMPYWADDEAERAERILREAKFEPVQTVAGAHARTLRVDLRGKDEATLFAGKSCESLRRKLRQAEKAGAVARRGTGKDLRTLEALDAALMGAQKKGAKPRAYFDALAAIVDEGSRGAVFLCEHEGAAVSALYASRHGKRATFITGASASAEKSFSKMAPAMAAAIRWALAEGCETFDMGGIPLEGDTDEKRRSIAQFKLDFAKTPVRLVGEHARWL
jgi:lipid II:glycine glycyltransferase (peptidoglycan interpeptide bridge formation enzyme)